MGQQTDKTKYMHRYMVFELMDADLSRVIGMQHQLSEEHIRFFIYQMLCGLKVGGAKCVHLADAMWAKGRR